MTQQANTQPGLFDSPGVSSARTDRGVVVATDGSHSTTTPSRGLTRRERSEGESILRPWEGRSERTRSVLEALKTGPKFTSEMLEISTHRFACDIHSLREHGWKIVTELINTSGCRYTLEGWEPVRKINKTMKAAYYASPHWKHVSRARREFDEFQCLMCHSSNDLNVHHWQYELFNEPNCHLMTLCRNCHLWIHDRVSINFPKFASLDVVSRMEMLVEASAA